MGKKLNISGGIWPVLLIVLFVIAWVCVTVLHYARKSRQQWLAVDKRKLKVWEDEE